jgi:fatty acid/phospholipid biosynthesis enzyme
VVIAHGAVTARGAAAACKLAAELTERRITERIRERLSPSRAGHFLRRADRGPGGVSGATGH